MLFREVIVGYSEIHKLLIKIAYQYNGKVFSVKAGGTYTNSNSRFKAVK